MALPREAVRDDLTTRKYQTQMTLSAAGCEISKTSRNEASFGEYDLKRFKRKIAIRRIRFP